VASNTSLLPDLVENVSPGVVNISSTKFVKSYYFYGPGMDDVFMRFFGLPQEEVQKQSSLGSGFVLDDQGYILTNNHVVEHADEIMILFLNQKKIPATIVGRDKAMDLALLQLKGGAANKDLKPVKTGNSESARIGESVFAIGNPFGLQHSVSSGIISAKNRTIGLGAYDRFIQTDASINFGNSGGPLFNMKGEVIGINTAINAAGQGLGFAIPINDALSHVEEFKKYGRIVRPWLGVLGQNITPALQYHYDLPTDTGVVVTNLAVSGPARKAGIRAGDVVVSINGKDVKQAFDISRELAEYKPGDKITVELRRGSSDRSQLIKKEIKLTLAPDPEKLPQGIL
jgi:serine protease Do